MSASTLPPVPSLPTPPLVSLAEGDDGGGLTLGEMLNHTDFTINPAFAIVWIRKKHGVPCIDDVQVIYTRCVRCNVSKGDITRDNFKMHIHPLWCDRCKDELDAFKQRVKVASGYLKKVMKSEKEKYKKEIAEIKSDHLMYIRSKFTAADVPDVDFDVYIHDSVVEIV